VEESEGQWKLNFNLEEAYLEGKMILCMAALTPTRLCACVNEDSKIKIIDRTQKAIIKEIETNSKGCYPAI
jgi:hypothetical protein